MLVLTRVLFVFQLSVFSFHVLFALILSKSNHIGSGITELWLFYGAMLIFATCTWLISKKAESISKKLIKASLLAVAISVIFDRCNILIEYDLFAKRGLIEECECRLFWPN